MIETQVGGKFARSEMGLFALKDRIAAAGIAVQFPEGDGIIAVKNGVELTFDPEASGVTFYEKEIAYLKSIKRNPFHVVHNKFGEMVGYVGESAGIEVGYALVHNKPIVMLYEPDFSTRIPDNIRTILEGCRDSYCICRLDELPQEALFEYLNHVSASSIDYGLNVLQEGEVLKSIEQLLESYK